MLHVLVDLGPGWKIWNWDPSTNRVRAEVRTYAVEAYFLFCWIAKLYFPHRFEDQCKSSDQTLRQKGQWCLTQSRVKPRHIWAVSQTLGSGGYPGGRTIHEDGCEQTKGYPGGMLWMKITYNIYMFKKEGKCWLHLNSILQLELFCNLNTDLLCYISF